MINDVVTDWFELIFGINMFSLMLLCIYAFSKRELNEVPVKGTDNAIRISLALLIIGIIIFFVYHIF